MTDDAGGGLTNCPHCGYPIPADRPPTCPQCHHPLIFDEVEPPLVEGTAGSGLTKPSHTTDNTIIIEPASDPRPRPKPPPPPPASTPPGRTCPRCGLVNPLGRVRCERCATLLEVQPTRLPPPLVASPPRLPWRTGLTIAIVVGALLLALALGFLTYTMA